MFNRLSTAIGTCNSFENILGAGPNSNQIKGRETRKGFPTKQVRQTFLSSCTVALRNRHLLDLSFRENRFPREGISSNANIFL